MNKTLRNALLATTALSGVAFAGPANASLTLFNSFTGNDLVSTDGCGSTTQSCTLQSNIQLGSNIVAAYLYTSEFQNGPSPNGTSLSVGANNVMPTFTPLGINVSTSNLQAFRANVTSFVQANANIGGLTTWTAHEVNANQDGEALVIVYSNPTVQPTTHTISILDGFSSSSGDTSHVSFNALPAGFTAQMMIGDGFSFDGTNPNAPTNTNQVSTITVNGTNLTTVAGHCDDDQDATCANGNLITMGATNAGSHDDPFTPFPCNGLGCIGSDHERYNLGNIFNVGDTSATLMTVNPSNDDNIFLEVFDISGNVVFQTPEPGSLALLGAALASFGLFGRRRRSQS
jgi:hypothetical protein